MKSLYEINSSYEAIAEKVEQYCIENGGELPPDLEQELESIEQERHAKIMGIGLFYKNQSAYEEALEAEIKSLIKRRDSSRKLQERLKAILQNNLKPGEKVNETRLSIGWRKSERVVILDEESVPLTLCKVKTEVSLSHVKNYLKAMDDKEKENCKFAKIEENINIQIK